MNWRLIRHTTMKVEFAGRQILADPMLVEPRSQRSLTVVASAARNPMGPRSRNHFHLEPIRKPK